MKKVLFVLLLCVIASIAYSQANKSSVYLKGDSVFVQKDGGNAELIIKSSTRNVPGYLYNVGNGRTTFKVPNYIDSQWTVGDTLKWRISGITYDALISGSGGSGANNYTTAVTYSNFVLTTVRNGLSNLTTNISHTHPQSDIVHLSDSLLSKVNTNGTNAGGTWNISITGNAGTVTNGVYTNGSYANPAWITSFDYQKLIDTPLINASAIDTARWNNGNNKNVVDISVTGSDTKTITLTSRDGSIAASTTFTDISTSGSGTSGVSSFKARTGDVVPAANDYTFAQIGTKPTTLAGYGITDAASSTHTHTFASLTSKPTTLAGYGITDPIVLTSGSYSNPSWITALNWNKITVRPTTLAGYGITDAASVTHTHTFASITAKPTTLVGYGITDAVNTTLTYGNPTWITTLAWSKITGEPTTISGYGITNAYTKAQVDSAIAANLGGGGGGGAVSSIFGRTGAITAQTGDYTFAQIGLKPTTLAGYGITNSYTKTQTDSAISANRITGYVSSITGSNTNGFTWTITPTGSVYNLALSLRNASASQSGQLSAADYASFAAKADPLNGGASTIAYTDLALNFALVSNGSGKVIASGVSTTKLNYLLNVNSDLQAQLDNISAGIGTLTVTSQAANYTPVLGDAQKLILLTKATAQTFTIPTHATVAFPVGTQITIEQDNTGQTTIVGVSGVTVNSSNGLKIRARYGTVTCIQKATNVWVAAGDLTP